MSKIMRVMIITDKSINVFDTNQRESDVKISPKDNKLELKLEIDKHTKYEYINSAKKEISKSFELGKGSSKEI